MAKGVIDTIWLHFYKLSLSLPSITFLVHHTFCHIHWKHTFSWPCYHVPVVKYKTLLKLGWMMKTLKEWHITHLMKCIGCLSIVVLLSFNMKKSHNFIAQWYETKKFWLEMSYVKHYFQSASSSTNHFSSTLFVPFFPKDVDINHQHQPKY